MKLKKNQKVPMGKKEIQKMNLENTKKAVNIVTLIPLLVLRDEYGFGEKRLKRFLEQFKDTFDAYNEGYLDLEDIARVLKEEANIDINEELK